MRTRAVHALGKNADLVSIVLGTIRAQQIRLGKKDISLDRAGPSLHLYRYRCGSIKGYAYQIYIRQIQGLTAQ